MHSAAPSHPLEAQAMTNEPVSHKCHAQTIAAETTTKAKALNVIENALHSMRARLGWKTDGVD
jgi:hypothetical protein